MKLSKILSIGAVGALLLIESTSAMAQQVVPESEIPPQILRMIQAQQQAPATPRTGEVIVPMKGEISQDMADKFAAQSEAFLRDPRAAGVPVKILLDSPGGDLNAAWAIVDQITALQEKGHPVTVVVHEMVASAATVIFEAAAKRVVYEKAMMMIHQPAFAVASQKMVMMQPDELNSVIEGLNKSMDEMCQFMAGASGGKLTADQIQAKIAHGMKWFISAKEMMDLGLADEVIPANKHVPHGAAAQPVETK